jgi:hypothetical protein
MPIFINGKFADIPQCRKEGGQMTDENADTADLTMNEKLDRILAELSDMNEDTGDIMMRLDRIESRLESLAIDVADVRAAQQRTDYPGDATQ